MRPRILFLMTPPRWHFTGTLSCAECSVCHGLCLAELSLILSALDTQDGMDQSKWALPRQRLLQSSKDAQNMLRPRMKVHAVWAHGVVLEMFVVHPGVPHDSALVLECLMRTMEDVSEIFQKHGKPLPREMLSWVPCLVPGMFLDLSA